MELILYAKYFQYAQVGEHTTMTNDIQKM